MSLWCGRDESVYVWSEKDIEEVRSVSVFLVVDVVYSLEFI